ncbi:MAG: KilA-N domain-containing protein [Marinilabiliaceae bacterium]
MKTNQVLTRQMGEFIVHQRTKDGMFNATDLLKQWNAHSGQKKSLDHFFENKATKEFVKTIENEEKQHTRNSVYLKSRASKGLNAGTWMHPFLFIDFAMWLNPRFKYQVIKFVYDELIKYRHEAGDGYRLMTSSLKKIVPSSELTQRIQEVAKAINYIVYDSHAPGIRNHRAEENKARELAEIERDIAKFIDLGFIKNYDALINHLRQRWTDKYVPAIV